MTEYFALTIGPIYKTLGKASKTRELWAASFIFHRYMQLVIAEINPFGNILFPVIPEKLPEISGKTGYLPDQLIMKIDKEKTKDFNPEEAVGKATDNLFDELNVHDNRQKLFFEKYFQFYYITISLNEKSDPLKTIFPILVSMEQNASMPPGEHEYINLLFEDLKSTGLFKRVFADKQFPSLFKVSAGSLSKITENIQIPEELGIKDKKEVYKTIFTKYYDKDDEDEQIRRLLRIAYNNYPEKETERRNWKREPLTEQYRFYHNYIAIVHADGDNFGQALEVMYHEKGHIAVKEFSRMLIEFGLQAARLVKAYRGQPVYMGGDDLLFFAPVRNGKETIFHLVKKINDRFIATVMENKTVSDAISEWNSGITYENRRKRLDLSYSFGISVSYYKHPLKEALETARNLLFETAKQVPGKNALTIKLLKHSGHFFDATFKNNWHSFETTLFHFLDSIIEKAETIQKNEDYNKTLNFLSSLQYKLDTLSPIIKRILCGRQIDLGKASFREHLEKYLPDEGSREYLIKNLADNFFNESDHDQNREFIDGSFKYLLTVYRELEDLYGNNYQTADKAINLLYSALRLQQFIIQPENPENEQEE